MRASQCQRHRNWVRRFSAKAKAGSWRPIPWNRQAAKHWLSSLDNQFKSLSVQGLIHFLPRLQSPPWTDWRRWRVGFVSMDMGGDGVSAIHAAQFKFGLALECYPDPPHGANRDIDGAIKHAGLFPLILLLLVSWNLPSGPFKEDFRHRQIVERMEQCFRRNSPTACPLFEGMCSKKIQDFKDQGYPFSEDALADLQAWELMKARAHFPKQGRRITLCRFQAVVKALKDHNHSWHIELFGRTCVALEEYMLKGKALDQKMHLKAAGQAETVAEGGGTTSSNVLSFEA